jgi:hypothetical protein
MTKCSNFGMSFVRFYWQKINNVGAPTLFCPDRTKRRNAPTAYRSQNFMTAE